MKDTAWLLGCAILVFLMQPGFMCLESGLTRSKNSINVAVKNFSDFSISALLYWLFGFGLMFGRSIGGWLGGSDFAISVESQPDLAAFFVFQLMFCGTSTTIISGAVAERLRFLGYIMICAICSGPIYPLFGHWVWNGIQVGDRQGWLGQLGFYDFAGSTVVHSIGAWVALAALLVVGPRTGRFDDNGQPRKMGGSNLPFSMLGAMFLWMGWLGFNGGSTLALNDQVPPVIVHTLVAGVAGMLTGGALSLVYRQIPDVAWLINGSLAGMVAVTACCNVITTPIAILVGSVGAIVALIVEAGLERCKIDDAVTAVAIHGGAGAWGTLAVGLFGNLDHLGAGIDRPHQILVQLLGIGVAFAWAFGLTYPSLILINRFFPLRVSPEDEEMGLNMAEHQVKTEIYDLFQVMDRHARSVDLEARAPVDVFTEAGYIAARYNQVLDTLQTQSEELVELNTSLETTVRDRTEELEKTLLHLQETQLQIVQSEKMSALGNLVAGVAHEINNPIGFISGNLNAAERTMQDLVDHLALYREGATDDEISRHATEIDLDYLLDDFPKMIESMKVGCDRVKSISTSLRTFSRADTEYKVSTNLHECIDSTLLILKYRLKSSQFRPGIEVIQDYGELPLIECFPGQLNQVFMNLLANAIDMFDEIAQNLSIAELQDNPQRITIQTQLILPKNIVEIRIADNGKGMTEDVRSKIFDHLFTTKAVGKGTGLGLAIARQIVTEKHHGCLTVTSEVGKGTEFCIQLPYATPSSLDDV